MPRQEYDPMCQECRETKAIYAVAAPNGITWVCADCWVGTAEDLRHRAWVAYQHGLALETEKGG